MRSVLVPLAVAFGLLAPVARADDAADARAIIEKAVKARGDKPDAKFTTMTWKDQGKFTGGGFELPYTAEWAVEAPDKYRFVFAGTFGGTKINMTVVVNGEKAWESDGTQTREITGEKLEQTRNEAYQFRVTALTPLLTDKGFTLATVQGKDAAGKPTVGVKVTHDKKPAITLFFDNDTGLLAKRQLTVKDEFQKWKEVTDEATFGGYKEVGGKKRFTSLKITRDGKPMIDATLSDVKEGDKLDAKLFEKP